MRTIIYFSWISLCRNWIILAKLCLKLHCFIFFTWVSLFILNGFHSRIKKVIWILSLKSDYWHLSLYRTKIQRQIWLAISQLNISSIWWLRIGNCSCFVTIFISCTSCNCTIYLNKPSSSVREKKKKKKKKEERESERKKENLDVGLERSTLTSWWWYRRI